MDRLEIDSRARDWLAPLGLNSCAAFLESFAPNLPATKTVHVVPRTLQLPGGHTRDVFFKLYNYPAPAWQFIGRRSKARCEFDNYAAFEQLGIPTARRVACGDQRDGLGRLRRAFIVTETIPRTWPLPGFVEEFCPNRATKESRQLRAELIRQLARLTRQMHEGGFVHHDLVWRNILVSWTPPEPPQLWWIDCPRGTFSRSRRRQLKDLASLDKLASQQCTRAERLVFLRAYAGDDCRTLAVDVVQYREHRWPNG